MTQFAVIKKLTAPDKAEVEVLRGTACGGDCGSCGAPSCRAFAMDVAEGTAKLTDCHRIDLDKIFTFNYK